MSRFRDFYKKNGGSDFSVEYVTSRYLSSRRGNSGNLDEDDFSGYVYDFDDKHDEDDFYLEDVYRKIPVIFHDDEAPGFRIPETATFAEARALPTNYDDYVNRGDADVSDDDVDSKHLLLIDDAPNRKQHRNIRWTELSMIEIIRLQGCGAFDRLTESTRDNVKDRDLLNNTMPTLIFKIDAPCVVFLSEVPSTGRGINDNSNLNMGHIKKFDKWNFDNKNMGEIRVWYVLQNTQSPKLFVDGKLNATGKLKIRYWYKDEVMYNSLFNTELVEKLPSVVKFSRNSVAKNITKIEDPDDAIFEVPHKLKSTPYNNVVTSFMGYLKDEVDDVVENANFARYSKTRLFSSHFKRTQMYLI